MQKYRVMIYCRYRDDMIVYEDEKVFQEYLDEMRQKAKGVWSLKLEGQSEETIYYLDITIFKGDLIQEEGLFAVQTVHQGLKPKDPIKCKFLTCHQCPFIMAGGRS
jgi:hypothetical protein